MDNEFFEYEGKRYGFMWVLGRNKQGTKLVYTFKLFNMDTDDIEKEVEIPFSEISKDARLDDVELTKIAKKAFFNEN